MRAPAFISRLGNTLGLQPNVTSYLAQEMTAPHRHYHTIAHLGLMDRYLWNLATNGTYSDAEFARKHMRNWMLAMLFHDIVYDPAATDNEELSALEMKLRIGNMKRVNIGLIEQMILATKGHNLATGWPQSDEERAINWFLKADLSILWSPEKTYQWYARGVRKEYAHVPNELYRKGRADVLSKLANEIQQHLSLADIAQMTINHDWEKRSLEKGALDV